MLLRPHLRRKHGLDEFLDRIPPAARAAYDSAKAANQGRHLSARQRQQLWLKAFPVCAALILLLPSARAKLTRCIASSLHLMAGQLHVATSICKPLKTILGHYTMERLAYQQACHLARKAASWGALN